MAGGVVDVHLKLTGVEDLIQCNSETRDTVVVLLEQRSNWCFATAG